jgi:hypothetical protein
LVPNVYFDLTHEFNQHAPVAALSSGQAVVHYRLAIMSKDGDWILRETPEACERILTVLAGHGATYRPAPPLDVRWLRGGWSSHFEYLDVAERRIRCDFVSRPPRVTRQAIEALFRGARQGSEDPLVIDRETLIRLKQTGRAKDYAVIGELARQLSPGQELEWTTDVDRILQLAVAVTDAASARASVRAARSGAGRAAVVGALAQEIDELQQADRKRLIRFQRAAEPYLTEFRRTKLCTLPLDRAHDAACRLAEVVLPQSPLEEPSHDDAQ